jgi:signal transduction histidine kinase
MTEEGRRYRMSLTRKLSLLTGAVIAVSLAIVLVVAYEVLTKSALSGAAEGLQRATRQLASSTEMGLRQSRLRYDSIAHDPAIKRALVTTAPRSQSLLRRSASDDSAVAAAERVLARLTSPIDSGLPVELWSANGQRIAFVGSAQPIVPESSAGGHTFGTAHLPQTGVQDVVPVDSLQVGQLYSSGGRVYLWFVQPILDRGRPIGYLAHQRRIATNPQGDRNIRALAGEGVSMYFRTTDGSVWSSIAGAPTTPSRREANDPSRARRGAGDEVLIADAQVGGTPLVITMESRVRDVLAAPRRTIRQLLLVGMVLLIAGMGAALFIGHDIARPIAAIADGAEAIARGDYETRVAGSGTSEVARLAESFNHMANEVSAAQRALQQKTADAQSANRAKSEFLATMSHELRTPLNAIAGYTELLEMGLRGPLTDAQRRDLARIRASGQHLLGLISGVLDLNRIERGQVNYTLTHISVEPFLADLDALVSPQAAAKSLTLHYERTEEPLTILADREKLRQIILNLLSNAIRYTPAGGRITLTASPAGDSMVRICVQDTGAGIPEDRREQVFEPFVQLDRSLTQPQEGLGLGLSISRDLARGMDGDLTVTGSTGIGGGATFVLILPRGNPDELTDDARTSGETSAHLSATRVGTNGE